MAGRTLAIGDIHGSLNALERIAETVNFTPDDTLIFLGDYIDRGPHSKEVLDWLLSHQNTHNLITLAGNHEFMMLRALDDPDYFPTWTIFGGSETLESFRRANQAIDGKYTDFIHHCPLYHENDNFIFVHGGCDPDLPLDQQDADTLCWLRFRNQKPHYSNKTIICGHTPQPNYIPGILPHAVCIDTRAYHPDGFLTCLDVDTGDYWQANNLGESRHNHISMP